MIHLSWNKSETCLVDVHSQANSVKSDSDKAFSCELCSLTMMNRIEEGNNRDIVNHIQLSRVPNGVFLTHDNSHKSEISHLSWNRDSLTHEFT